MKRAALLLVAGIIATSATATAMPSAVVGPDGRVVASDAVRVVLFRDDALSAPRIVDAWERDPCERSGDAVGLGSLGFSLGGSDDPGALSDRGMKVAATFAREAYRPATTDALAWLAKAGFAPGDGARAGALVARVDATRLSFEDGATVLPPIRIDFEIGR